LGGFLVEGKRMVKRSLSAAGFAAPIVLVVEPELWPLFFP